jgi:hypothetical protein
MKPALRRATTTHVVIALAALVIAGVAVGARIGFTAETQGSATFAGGWIGPATGLAAPTPSGYDAVLNWTPGTHGPVTGQQVWAVDNGTSSTCPSSGFTLAATTASASTSTYTVPNNSSVNGHWLCYQLVSTSASAWTATTNFSAAQLGLVAKTVVITNSGNNNKLTNCDKVTITFNQNVATGSVPTSINVCAGAAAGVIILGDTAGSGCSNGSDPYAIGVLTGISVSAKTKVAATAAVSGAVVTVTIGANGPNTSGSPTGFLAAGSVLSAALTDQAAACVAANCQPVPTGGF